jgi:hypothetical protein
MVGEVNLYKELKGGNKNIPRLVKLGLNATIGRLGMALTQHQREKAT